VKNLLEKEKRGKGEEEIVIFPSSSSASLPLFYFNN
jgi:hypothetical protein